MGNTTPIPDRVERILRKVGDGRVQLNVPLSREEVERFEQRHGVVLPDGYRSFLMQVGNGGAGPPHYGMAALGEPARDMRGEELRIWSELPDIGRPFPFTKVWVWEEGETSDEGDRDQIHHGCVYVGNDGCGAYWYLIVTGPERGNVWMICGEGMQPTSPKRDFLQWYEDWLDGVREWWT